MVLVIGVLNLYISSNENDWCHSAWVTSPCNIKGSTNHSCSLFASSLASSRTDHLFPLSSQSNPLSIMRRANPIYGPLVFGKSILSSFIFLFKPLDPRRNKLDIFNSCFDFSILITVLTTASQLLLWLQRLYSFSTLQLFLLPVTYSTRVLFVSSCY